MTTQEPANPEPDSPQGDHSADADRRPIWARLPILLGGAGGAVVLIVIAIVVVVAGRSPSGPDPNIYKPGHNPFLDATGPSCIGMPLDGDPVVYVVDSSSALEGYFDGVRGAVQRSLDTLRVRQRFGVVVWSEGKPEVLAVAGNTPASREAAIRLLDETQPSGVTDAAQGIRAALDLRPAVLCILAAKGPAPEVRAEIVRQIRDAGITLRCLALRERAPGLEEMAEQTGGSYQAVDLRRLISWLIEAG